MSEELRGKVALTLGNARKVIFGQDNMLEAILAGLVCEGHLLIEGMPGLGKTLSVNAMATLCDLSFNRVQFTPDLLPTDLIGTMIYNQAKDEFSTKFGPIFTQILLADEINRSPAKVQSALLEAMAEKQVTIGDKTHKLSAPFVVLATQNPIEQEGTYRLPEAQLDRFMMKIDIDYPNFDAEKSILDLSSKPTESLEAILSTDDLFELQEEVAKIFVDEKIKDLVVRIVHATRPSSELFPKHLEGTILAGASPRASIWLYKLGRFKAFMEGKDFVSPENIFSVVPDVLGHRVALSYEANIDNINPKSLVLEIAKSLV